jgi:hypothetical protein
METFTRTTRNGTQTYVKLGEREHVITLTVWCSHWGGIRDHQRHERQARCRALFRPSQTPMTCPIARFSFGQSFGQTTLPD